MKYLIFCMTTMLAASTAFSTDYYIDATDGVNSNSGTTILDPWNNFDQIKASTFSTGDTIHLHRGSQWSGELIAADTAGIIFQNYGDAALPFPVLEAMTDLGSAYIENFNLDIYTSDPLNSRLDDFSGKWFEQLGSGANNSILASTDTHSGSGVSIKLTHDGGSSPQLSSTNLVAIAADAEFEYKFWMKVVGGQTKFRVHTPAFSEPQPYPTWYYDDQGNWGPTNTAHIIFEPDGIWTEVTVPVVTPSFLSLPTLNFSSLSTGTKIYLDDFTLSAKWIASSTPGIYKRLMITPNVAPPTRVQVNGVDIVASNNLAELQSLPAGDLAHNGKWVWGGVNERVFYMYFDSQASLDAANIRVNRTNNSLIVISEPNIVLDGLRLENGGGGINVAADDATVHNCEVDNMLGNAMFVGRLNLPFYRINVSNNNVSNAGVGIYLQNIHDSIVDANTVTNIGISLSQETDNETIALQSGTGNIISNNILDVGIQGIGVWGSEPENYPANNNIFSGNIISNMEHIGIIIGGFLEGVANNLIHHNIIYHCGLNSTFEKAGGIRQNKNAGLPGINYYVHNVLYNNKNSFSGESNDYNYPNGTGGSGVTANFEYSNNISIDPTLRHIQLGRVELGTNPNVTGFSVIRNNLFHPQERSGDVLFSWNGLYTTLDDFQSMTISDTGSVTSNIGADPLFVNAPGLDFHLTPESPAIEVGSTLPQTAINNWQALLGQPDIGVFEYGGSDTDGDEVSDYDELCHDGDCADYDPYDPTTNPSGTDLNITVADSDGDGYNDGDEISAGTNPLNSTSTPIVSAPAMQLFALIFLMLGLSVIGFRCSFDSKQTIMIRR